MLKTKVESLSIEITQALKQDITRISDKLPKIQKDVAEFGAEKLKKTSPRDKGDYATGWKVKRIKNGFAVHNATKPQLTHVLENGHAKRNGGRVAAIPHIAPVEKLVIEEYEEKVEKMINE